MKEPSAKLEFSSLERMLLPTKRWHGQYNAQETTRSAIEVAFVDGPAPLPENTDGRAFVQTRASPGSLTAQGSVSTKMEYRHIYDHDRKKSVSLDSLYDRVTFFLTWIDIWTPQIYSSSALSCPRM
eukprot:1143137-Pelagomonas_calceolata.AAC.1